MVISTMHHSGYYLVFIIFGTTILMSFNILMKSFLHFFHYFFLFVQCFPIPTCLCSHEPHPLLLPDCVFKLHHFMRDCMCTYRKWLPTNTYKIFNCTVLSKVMKILWVKDHARNGKKPFCVITIESTCATLAVGKFKSMRDPKKLHSWV